MFQEQSCEVFLSKANQSSFSDSCPLCLASVLMFKWALAPAGLLFQVLEVLPDDGDSDTLLHVRKDPRQCCIILSKISVIFRTDLYFDFLQCCISCRCIWLLADQDHEPPMGLLSRGLEFLSGDGHRDSSFCVQGTLPVLQKALSTLSYVRFPALGNATHEALVDTVRFVANDLGHTGAGGAKTTSFEIKVMTTDQVHFVSVLAHLL